MSSTHPLRIAAPVSTIFELYIVIVVRYYTSFILLDDDDDVRSLEVKNLL